MKPCKSFLFSKNGLSMLKQLVLIPLFMQKYIYIYMHILGEKKEKPTRNVKQNNTNFIHGITYRRYKFVMGIR